MIIKNKSTATSGIFFAIWPRRTPEGWVSCEFLHWHWVEGWGWGSDGHYEYRRMIPQDRYDAGERAQAIGDAIYFSEQMYGIKAKHLGDLPLAEQERLMSGAKAYDPAGLGHPTRYETPPGDPKEFCREYRADGPTPCRYPYCRGYDEDGKLKCGGAR